jgi:hypothetical protein
MHGQQQVGFVNSSQTKCTMSSPAMPGPSRSARSAISVAATRHAPRNATKASPHSPNRDSTQCARSWLPS